MRRLYGFILLMTLTISYPAFSQQRWERTYGGGAGEQANSVQQTADGGYIIAGWTQSFGSGNKDIYLIKTNSQGDTLWTRTYGGGSDEEGYSVQQTLDGGYIVVGWTESFNSWHRDIYLVKTDAMGDTLWTKRDSMIYVETGNFVQQTRDSGYIIAGTQSYNFSFAYLVKTNSQGDTLWTRTYNWEHYADTASYGRCVRQTRDGGYIVSGLTHFVTPYLVRTNSQGDTLWTRTYPVPGASCFESVLETPDSGFIASGYVEYFGLFIVRTNPQGDTLWTKLYGGRLYGHSMAKTMDGGYIIAGDSASGRVFLAKINDQGNILWTRKYGWQGLGGIGRSVQQTQDGGYIIAGFTENGGSNQDFYVIKTDSMGSSSGVENETGGKPRPTSPKNELKAFPNPFTCFATVPGHSSERFSLYDISGRRVGVYRGDRIGEGLRAGVYFIKPEGIDGKPLRIVKVR